MGGTEDATQQMIAAFSTIFREARKAMKKQEEKIYPTLGEDSCVSHYNCIGNYFLDTDVHRKLLSAMRIASFLFLRLSA